VEAMKICEVCQREADSVQENYGLMVCRVCSKKIDILRKMESDYRTVSSWFKNGKRYFV